MFERFSDDARKALVYANQYAQKCHDQFIGPEHILIGLLEVSSGIHITALMNLKVNIEHLHHEVGSLAKSDAPTPTAHKLPQVPSAKKIIEYAIYEARGLGHQYVGAEHLLLGLVRENDNPAAAALLRQGLTLEDLRRQVRELVTDPLLHQAAPPPDPPRLNALDVHKLVGNAIREARELGHSTVGQGHVLLAMLREPEGIAAQTFTALGLSLDTIRDHVLKLLTTKPS